MPPFVLYAATSWGYHLARTPAASDVSLTLLVQFLKSSSVILWIRVLASLQQLEYLITASVALRTFVAARRTFNSTTQPSQHRLTDIELVEQWATDLLNVVGKFSRHLIEDPTAIRRLVPQLCPHRSAIYRQFSKQPRFSVDNISYNDWDDCLGRVLIDTGHRATQLICSARHLAVLTMDGMIFLWDCTNFENLPTINHDEFVSAMCFNSTGELLASYGYLTTRIWNAVTGRAVHTINNVPESCALSITFAEDDEKLIVGLDNRKVAVASFFPGFPKWVLINSGFPQEVEIGACLNSPTAIAFTANSAFVGVAYRGAALEVWDMVEKTRVNKCKRWLGYEGRRSPDWTGVMEVVWHPSGETLLGIYTDGVVFKWNPFEEFDHRELEADLYSGPSGIQCSPDGALFILSDQESVEIYDYEHMSLIYKLSSEDSVTDFCFSMDSRRIYDLRGSYCNIWEPNALFRLPDLEDRRSESNAEATSMIISNHASETFTDMPVRVTTLATRSSSELFCYGNEDGLVEMDNASLLEAQKVGRTRDEEAVLFLVWSEDGNYVAYSGASSVTVKKAVFALSCKTWTFETLLHLDIDLSKSGKTHQILLHTKADYLLVSGAKSVILYDLTTKKACAHLESDSSQRWAYHPTVADQLLGFHINSITLYSWKTLELVERWDINKLASPQSRSEEEETANSPSLDHHKAPTPFQRSLGAQDFVDEILVSTARNYAIMSMSREGPYCMRRWTNMQILSLSDAQDSDSQNITPVSIPEGIHKSIKRPLGIIGQNRLVYLDQGFWVCSWCIDTAEAEMQRHFFLPRDWMSAEALGLCTVTRDGVVLMPRKGEVAVIRSSLCIKRY